MATKKITNFRKSLQTKQEIKAYFDPIRREVNAAVAEVLAKHGLIHDPFRNLSYQDHEFHFTNKLNIRLPADVVVDDIEKSFGNLDNLKIVDVSKTMWNPEHPSNAERVEKQVEKMEKMLGHEYREGQKTYKLLSIADEKWAKFKVITRRNKESILTLEAILSMKKIS